MQARWAALTAAVLGTTLACAGGATHSEAPPLSTLRDSASYAVGLGMGNQLHQFKDEVEIEQVIQAIRDIMAGDSLRLTQFEAQQVMQVYGSQVQERQMATRAAQADSNRIKGEAYRAENATREGVQVTASGVQYEVLTAGTGPRPTATDRVRVHYVGTLIDGTEFDRSTPDEPVTFALNEVIPGWTEAIQLMPVGSKYRFVIPSELAYGPQGAGGDIGPNATLIFEVELLGIE